MYHNLATVKCPRCGQENAKIKLEDHDAMSGNVYEVECEHCGTFTTRQ